MLTNKEWNEEQQRVDLVKQEITNKREKLQNNTIDLKEGVMEIRKTFFDDIRLNFDDPKERVETEAAIRQQQELLSERERSHGILHKQINVLDRMKNSPYFGRIDFHENGEEQTDTLYIGIASVMDSDEENFLVYDWRAPISSLYYDYSPGPAEYKTMVGTIEGELELKRQFIIRDGTIKAMFDTGVTIGDELLQEVLGNNANTQMKSIVATIQKEQNKIIRNEKSRFLVVQGVAGSGKTSAALQRVAYLLYRYRDTLSSDNIMLLSPNPLFNSYVATVLPELGEDNMEQETLQGFIEKQLESDIVLEGPAEQMEYYLTAPKENGFNELLSGVQFKSTLEYKKLIDRYVAVLNTEGIAFTNIIFRGKSLLSSKAIEDHFYSLDTTLSIPNRMELTAEWILKQLAKKEVKEREKEWVTEKIQLLSKDEYAAVHKKLQEMKKKEEDSFDDIELEEVLLRKAIVRKRFRSLRKKVKQLRFINIRQNYLNLFKRWYSSIEFDIQLPSDWGIICQQTMGNLEKNKLSWEDATPYLYLKYLLKGRNANYRKIRHVFIDEAQDYSPFQFAYLKEIFPYSKMTILGDFNQAIYAHTAGKPTLLSNTFYESENFEKITLTRSYRSTQQIVEFTKDLVENGELIEPFNREGAKPEVFEVHNKNSLHEYITAKVNAFQSEGHQSIAIICKTMEECQSAYKNLQSTIQVEWMNDETYSFKKGVLIIPVYLAKGIEFDAVIIYNASNEQYNSEQERNLFYTACTRAMHKLAIYAVGKKSFFLEHVSSDKYELSTLKTK
jgi:DNA helicase II / ATP-dependent DNA helicase PcrA